MSLVFAAIAPHGDVIEDPDDARVAAGSAATRAAMVELGRRFEAARPEATLLLTPHSVHVEGAFAVVVAGTLHGALDWFLPELARVALACRVDRELAAASLAALRRTTVPVAGVSFGGNLATESVMPMDWGTLVPLWFMGGRTEPQVPVVVVSPARDRPLDEHVRAGRALAEAAAASGRRVALIASCDHGHAHAHDGRYGYDPAAAEFDGRVVDLVRQNRLDRLLELDPELVAAAKADSWWQMVMLHGALGDGWHVDVLSYEAPTYYGMLCAAYAPPM